MIRFGRLAGAVALAAAAAFVQAGIASADEVIFKNGDKLTGTVQTMDGGKLKIKSAVAGEVTVDMKDVATFTTAGPVELRLKDGTVLKQPVAAAGQGQVAVRGGTVQAQNVPLSEVKKINPNESFTGALAVGGLLTRGNSDTEQLNVNLDLTRRTETDRITLGAGYLFGRERDRNTGDKNTTTDNWFVFGKYDYFFNEKFYAFGSTRVEKDRIANLDLRVTPAAGAGYQFAEGPKFNLNAEAGIAYVFESYTNDGHDDHIAARLAYHVDKQLNDKVSVFHNLAYLPSLEQLNDYNLIADAGIRASITDKMFTELKLQWNYDATPAPGASRSDLRYILAVGWKF